MTGPVGAPDLDFSGEAADIGLVVIDGELIEKPVLRDIYRILAVAEWVAG